ncbi:MAG TPA: hypothetical protein PKV55_10305, partial [Nitrospira sp.]|nr:hypothetical protein [Nitrospira sp.]
LMDNAVEVSGGLSGHDRLVNNPSAALLEGDQVRVVTPAPGYDLITDPESARNDRLPGDQPRPSPSSSTH